MARSRSRYDRPRLLSAPTNRLHRGADFFSDANDETDSLPPVFISSAPVFAELDRFLRPTPPVFPDLLARKGPDVYTQPGRVRLSPSVVGVPPSARTRRLERNLQVLQVQLPDRTKVCVDRKQRKEVLFARGVAGRGGGSPGPYVRKSTSNWRC